MGRLGNGLGRLRRGGQQKLPIGGYGLDRGLGRLRKGRQQKLPIGGYDLDRGPICCLWKGTSAELPFEGNSRAVGCEASPVFRACRCFSVVGFPTRNRDYGCGLRFTTIGVVDFFFVAFLFK